MTETLQEQIEKLKVSMASLEEQRDLLGEALDPALESMHEKLAALEAQQVEDSVTTLDEELRVITILFSDVVGSTSLAEKLDPEEWRGVIAWIHETCGEIISKHNGHVAQYLGDGLLAFFGAQVASESDPENAIRAALEIQAALDKKGHPLQGNHLETIKLRIGIHTGLVVIGDLGAEDHKEFTATGDAMNLAARLQSSAAPGGVLISHDSYHYVRGNFEFTPQPPLQVKGKSDPLRTYLVRRERSRQFRTLSRGVTGIDTRTVGREREMEKIIAAFRELERSKKPAWVQLVGEPGIGKTRLVEDTREWFDLGSSQVHILKVRAYEGDQKHPYMLIRRLWYEQFQIAEDTPINRAEVRWVQGFQEMMGNQEVEPAHALGKLIGLPFFDSLYLEGGRSDPVQVRGRAIVVSQELISIMLEQMPLVLLVEDLHNADVSSQEYLFELFLGSAGAENGFFVLGSARPEWDPPDLLSGFWSDGYENEISLAGGFEGRWPRGQTAHLQTEAEDIYTIKMILKPLRDEAIQALAYELTQAVADVPVTILDLIVERAEGIPYYAEEMVNWMLDRGIIDRNQEPWRFISERMKDTPLPTTLQHLLLTRLSTLTDEERFCLQCGSVFGRNFWTGGVAALGSENNIKTLYRLKEQGFIDKLTDSSLEGQEEWSFHQNLMRETTYTTILKRERTHLHRKASDWLVDEASNVGQLEIFAGLLGEHYEQAGDLSLAVDWYLQAGEHSISQGGISEAHSYLDRSLDLLPPIDKERRWLALLRRVEIQFEARARQNDIEALIELAGEFENQSHMAQAMYHQGHNLILTGEFRQSLAVLEETLDISRSAGNEEVEIYVLADLSQVHTHLRNISTARTMAEMALAKAEQLEDEEILASIILPIIIYYDHRLGDVEPAFNLIKQLVDISRRQKNRSREGLGMNLLGNRYLILGFYKNAREAFQGGFDLAVIVGSRLLRAHALKYLGCCHWRLADTRTAREMLEEAITEFSISGQDEDVGEARLYLAMLLESIEDYPSASIQHAQIIKVSSITLQQEALVGLARCDLWQGNLDQAYRRIEDVWNYLIDSGSSGMYFEILAYKTCVDIFDALGDTDRAQAAAEAGYTELMKGANRINDPQWRRSFLRNVPEHREMIAIWERMND